MAFTWFDKFAEVCEYMSDEQKNEMIIAIGRYGMYNEWPEFSEKLMYSSFASIREDIDNSRTKRANGAKGGRPETTENQKVKPPSKTTENKDEKPPAETTNNQGKKPPAETTENQKLKPPIEKTENPIQTKPIQTNTSQTKERGARGARFHPPTAEEVECFARGNDLSIDAQNFCDYYAAQGWRLSNGNAMKDWKAAARRWSASQRGGDPNDAYGNLF